MKLSDYVAEFLVKEGVKHTFGITGGAIVHILDSIYRNPHIEHICNSHEQASAMAVDAYSRITGNIGVGITTSGPGATNLLTGLCCSYYDSIPAVFITGQVPTSQLKRSTNVRQIGFQETNVISIYSSVTKYSVLVDQPEKIRYELEKAFYLAKSGRPGPVLLDICDDVQRADINPNTLKSFKPREKIKDNIILGHKVSECITLLQNSNRPVIILGNGIKLAKAEVQAYELINKLKCPVALTWATMDLLPDDHPLLIRDFGVSANRAGNFAVQNSDLILAVGTRLDTHEIGSRGNTFAREAKKIVVDIDESELEKYHDIGMNVDVLINADVRDFFAEFLSRTITGKNISDWTKRIREWRNKYTVCPIENYNRRDYIDPYVFMGALSDESSEGDIIITDAGANLTWTMQGFRVKTYQKLFSAFNHSPMGYSLPASIGASIASANKQVICIIGDGGLQMNVQELATIARYNLPIKIFLLNNGGYGIIRQTQDTWLDSRHYASSPESGLGFPNFISLANAYGIGNDIIRNHTELNKKIRKVLDNQGSILCDVTIDPDAKISPKLSFGRPIEDSEPLLDRDEFLENMIAKPLDASLNENLKKSN